MHRLQATRGDCAALLAQTCGAWLDFIRASCNSAFVCTVAEALRGGLGPSADRRDLLAALDASQALTPLEAVLKDALDVTLQDGPHVPGADCTFATSSRGCTQVPDLLSMPTVTVSCGCSVGTPVLSINTGQA